MSRPLLFLPPGTTVEVTTRAIRSLLLLPPTRQFAPIVVGILARAQELYPVLIIHCAVMPFSGPRRTKNSRRPLVHAATEAAREAFETAYRGFVGKALWKVVAEDPDRENRPPPKKARSGWHPKKSTLCWYAL